MANNLVYLACARSTEENDNTRCQIALIWEAVHTKGSYLEVAWYASTAASYWNASMVNSFWLGQFLHKTFWPATWQGLELGYWTSVNMIGWTRGGSKSVSMCMHLCIGAPAGVSVCLSKNLYPPPWQHEASIVREVKRFGPLALLQLLQLKCPSVCLSGIDVKLLTTPPIQVLDNR